MKIVLVVAVDCKIKRFYSTPVGIKKTTAEGSCLAQAGQRRSDEIKNVLLSTRLPKKQWVGAREWGREQGSRGEGEGEWGAWP